MDSLPIIYNNMLLTHHQKHVNVRFNGIVSNTPTIYMYEMSAQTGLQSERMGWRNLYMYMHYMCAHGLVHTGPPHLYEQSHY